MKKKSFVILIVFLQLMFYSVLQAQTPDENMAVMNKKQIKSVAAHAKRNGDIYAAIDYYNYLFQLDSTKGKYKFILAELYYKARDYENALIWHQKAHQSNPKKYISSLYYMAQSQKNLGLYSESIVHFKAFLKAYKSSKNRRYYRKMSKVAIQGAEMALENLEQKSKVEYQHLNTSINKAHIESSPQYLDSNISYYVSMREDEIVYYDIIDTNEQIPARNIHKADLKNGEWIYAEALDFPAKDELNVSSFVMSEDKQSLYFTICEKNWKNKMVCSIYKTTKQDGVWTQVEKLPAPVNDPVYTSTQPTLGISSKNKELVLYFVSDRPGGKGGLDIWYATYNSKKNTFDKVRNAGSKINTLGDEMTPYYNLKQHALYFSSDAWPSYGGLDVFRAYGEQRKWGELENLGHGINSESDDLYFTLAPSKDAGMFVSNREGGISLKNKTCCDDLYEFTYYNYIDLSANGRLIPTKDSLFYNYLKRKKLIASHSKVFSEPLKLGKKEVRLYMVNKKTGERILIDTKLPEDGAFDFELEQGKDYEMEIDNSGEIIIKSISTHQYATSEKLNLGDFLINILPDEPILLNNIYYNFDKSNLTRTSKSTLDTTILELMKAYPKVIIEIRSHTDSKGEDEYNMELSQKRAESVVRYLAIKGIERHRLKAKGYGETLPIAQNKNADGTDNPEGRAKNRRTEFRVVGFTKEVILYDEELEND